MDTKNRHCFLGLKWFLFVSVSLLLAQPASAVPKIEIRAQHTKAISKGISETRFVIGLNDRAMPSSHSSRASVLLTFLWSNDLGKPEIFTNTDRSLIAIQTMPYWWKAGRARFGRRICLLVSTPHQEIKVIKDFSEHLNHLRLANVSRWDHLAGHYYRPASTIFLTAQSMAGRNIYANQYAVDPKEGLPEHNNIGAKVSLNGNLSFLSFTSQGF